MNSNNTVRRQADDFLTLSDLWHLCVSHWNWFVISLVLCVGVAAYYLAVSPDMYTRQASVLVKQENTGKNVGGKTVDNDISDIGLVTQTTNVANVQRRLVSLDVLAEVARRVMHISDTRQALRQAESMQARLKAEVENDKSTIVTLQYTDESPQVAEKVLNTIVAVYNEKWMKEKNQVAISTSHFISERLKLLEHDLGIVDDSISRFKTRHKITDIEHVSDIYLQQQSQSDAEILRLNSQRAMAHYILDLLKKKTSGRQLLPTNTGIGNEVAEAQITHYNSLLLQLKSNLMGTSTQNPLIIKQEEQLDDLRKNILATVGNQIKTFDIQLNALKGYNGEANSKITSNPGQVKHLVSVEREQKVKESLYLYLLQKQEENEISMTYSAVNTQIIDMPHGSDSPTAPNKRLVLFGAVLFALLVPVVVLFVRESFDNTVRDRFDIEQKTSLSLVGDVPVYVNENTATKGLWNILPRRHAEANAGLVVQPDRQDMVNEAFRYIRTNLEFMNSPQRNSNVYVVTSSNEGSGKTFVAANLAIALAIAGKRVLLVDGDLRHASASRLFLSEHTGLADYLAEKETDVQSLLYSVPRYPTLQVLPVGTIPPNPTELLSRPLLEKLLAYLRPQYDFILIDCPPFDSLADAGIMERYADRTLFIIRAGLFLRSRLGQLEADVQNGKFKHVSVILNATKSGGRYGYRYGYRYGHRYGHRYGAQNSYRSKKR